MKKKTIDSPKPSFIQAINVANQWCTEWEDNLLSDEVLADRIAELTQSQNGARGFFAYALSDIDCTLLDRLPTSLIFKLREQGEPIVEIVVKNLIMSSAQILHHQRLNNKNNQFLSRNISDRCINLLKVLETKLVAQMIKKSLKNLDKMGNSLDNSTRYDNDQKKFIREVINKIAY